MNGDAEKVKAKVAGLEKMVAELTKKVCLRHPDTWRDQKVFKAMFPSRTTTSSRSWALSARRGSGRRTTSTS